MKSQILLLGPIRTLALLTLVSIAPCLPGTMLAPTFGQTGSKLEGEATGTVTISRGDNTKTINLKYAYALDPSTLYFTDRPLPEDPLLWHDYMRVMANDRKLNALHVLNLGMESKSLPAKERVNIMISCGACECKDDFGTQRELRGYGDLERKVVAGVVSGKISSESFEAHCRADEYVEVSYQVAFKAKLAPDTIGLSSPGAEDKPGTVYAQFYKAVMAEDAKEVRRLVASEHAKYFDGANAQKNAARLKSLIKPFSRVWMTQFYLGDKYAGLHLEEEGQAIDPRPKLVYKTTFESLSNPPPPPPPPPPSAPKAAPAPRNIPRAASQPKAPAPRRLSSVAKALLVFEGGEWKIDWWTFFGSDQENLISNVETFKTSDEVERAIEEEYWRMEEGATPLAAGGGEAGKAYLEYCQAERAGNKRAMLKYLTGAQHDLYADPGLTIKRGATIWKDGSALDYTNIEVLGGRAGAEGALLEVQALRRGARIKGRVMMILEEGQWKVDKEDWQE
ncbi:MAG TPA: hypothetical protein VF131_18740 [Blastocatellia bacterium]|nr:hypothetical protein [Blastocatellia bacterium]